MHRLPLITSKDQGGLRSFFSDAQKVGSFQELEQLFLTEVGRVIPNENPCWNNWSSDASVLQSVVSRKYYHEQFSQLFESLLETLPSHPLFRGADYSKAVHYISERPSRISEQISARDWAHNNPLHREVYRHVDATHQLAFHFVWLRDRSMNFTLNRPTRDFDERETQLCTAMGWGLADICRQLEQKNLLEARVKLLTGRLFDLAGVDLSRQLSPKEILTLGEISQGGTVSEIATKAGVSTHTYTERLSSIREKLHLESTPQLKALLRAYREENT